MGGILSPPKPKKPEPKPAPEPIEKEDAPELKVESDDGRRRKKARGTESLTIKRLGGTSRPTNAKGSGLTVQRGGDANPGTGGL